MRARAGSFLAALVASVLLAGRALAQTAAPDEAPAPGAGEEPKGEAAARVGVMFPGEMSPVNWFHTETQTSPSLWLDVGWVLLPGLSLGPYLQYSPFSFKRMSGSNEIGSGDGTFVSLGAAAKGRWALSEKVGLRGGATLGRNFVSYEGESNTGGTFKASGGGWNIGLLADLVWRASPRLGASVQLAFLSQLGGSANVEGYPTNITAEGDTRDFNFAPIFFVTVGPELFF